jgi:hypothetical protein
MGIPTPTSGNPVPCSHSSALDSLEAEEASGIVPDHHVPTLETPNGLSSFAPRVCLLSLRCGVEEIVGPNDWLRTENGRLRILRSRRHV